MFINFIFFENFIALFCNKWEILIFFIFVLTFVIFHILLQYRTHVPFAFFVFCYIKWSQVQVVLTFIGEIMLLWLIVKFWSFWSFLLDDSVRYVEVKLIHKDLFLLNHATKHNTRLALHQHTFSFLLLFVLQRAKLMFLAYTC